MRASSIWIKETNRREEVVGLANPPYVPPLRSHVHKFPVISSDSGELWLLVGTDSGFEGKTTVYYQQITATLVPVLG